MKPTMKLTIFKPINGDNPTIQSIDYGENPIPFGRSVDFVPYNDLLNVLNEAEQREHIFKEEIEKLKNKNGFPLRPMFKNFHRAAVFEGMHDSIKKIMDDLMTLEEVHYSLSMLMNYFSWKTEYLNQRNNKE